MEELIKRLSRYSEQCVAYKLDADFADAVQTAIAELAARCLDLHSAEVAFAAVKRDLKDCRNELCLKCGDYKMKHRGACNGCRWDEGDW